MRRLLILLLLAHSAYATYSFHRTVTVDHTLVPSTQTNFPVAFSGTYTFLKNGGGGQVQNANGYDIIFSSDAAGSSPLACEQESYNASTGAVTYWVKVPSLSSSSDTVIYIQYGDGAISTPQCAGTTVWDSNFKAVYHMGTAATMLLDSTSNANNLTNFNSVTFTASGNLGGAATFSGANALYALTPPTTATSAFTVSAWANESSSSNAFLVSNGVPPNGYGIVQFSSFECLSLGGIGMGGACGSSISFSWQFLAFTSSGNTNNLYKAASLVTGPYTFTPVTPTTGFSIGAELTAATPTFTLFNNAIEDEVRISDIARSVDWLVTEYHSIVGPATFYAVGPAVGGGGGTKVFPILY